jgi:hypothetical protein
MFNFCFNSCYLPQPARVWSRVQNSCSFDSPNLNLDLNSLNPNSPNSPQMLAKGNILQYKCNSSNLTNIQKYSKIAKGKWVNRNVTWATQTTSYSNPNTTSLKRNGNINIAIDPITGAIIGPTDAPVTCQLPVIPSNPVLPENVANSSQDKEPPIPPPVEPTEGSYNFPEIIPEAVVEPIVIQDGGSLLCSVQENICTGETTYSVSQKLCNLTSDSDVPGPIQQLCWDDKINTWYPRQRYVMSNSTDKWPINYKFLTSAVNPSTPILNASLNENTCNEVTLTWVDNDKTCLPITSYNIYLNNDIYQRVSANTKSTQVYFNSGDNIIYIRAVSNKYESIASNIIKVTAVNNFIVLSNSYIKSTPFENGNGVIIETTIVPDFNSSITQGFAEILICNDINTNANTNTSFNILLVGGGGGGVCGNYPNYSGGGGGGGSIALITDASFSANEQINLSIGSGGAGRNISNGGSGNSAGKGGYATQLISQNYNILCEPGNAGLGIGTTAGQGGGDGGTVKNASTNTSTSTSIYGYGGGGGGGAIGPSTSTILNGGNGGNGCIDDENDVNYGVDGGRGTTQVPGNGGDSGLPFIFISELNKYLYLGGGGSGGYKQKGGAAGDGTGGNQETADSKGGNATNYGGGGGGGASSNTPNNGGNGANGVVIIYKNM